MNHDDASQTLFDLLVTKNFDPQALDAQGKPSAPEDATMFSFDYTGSSGKDYGTVVLLLGDDLDVFCGDNTGKSIEDGEDRKEWFDGFLYQLKNWSVRNVPGTLNIQNLNKLKYSMQGQAAIKEGLFEGWSGKKDVSWNAAPTEARLMIKHKRVIGEGEARYRYIESLFIETAEGERFKLPFESLAAGKAMLEHVRQGGKPYDIRGNHIGTIVQEMKLLNRFQRASQGKIFEGETAHLVEEAAAYYETLKHNLKSLTTRNGYKKYFESWSPANITDEDVIIEDLRHLFVEQNIDSRVEQALPLLAKLKQEQAMKEINVFESMMNLIMEGTWSLPDTPQKQSQLVELLSQELPVGPDATNATEQLYDILGDDILFDQLGDLAREDANADARTIILNRLEQMKSNPAVAQVIGKLKIETNPAEQPEQDNQEYTGDGNLEDEEAGVMEGFNSYDIDNTPCPKCHEKELTYHQGTNHVQCGACGRGFSLAGKEIHEAAGDVMFKHQEQLDRLERLRDLARRIGNTEKAEALDKEIKAIYAANPVGMREGWKEPKGGELNQLITDYANAIVVGWESHDTNNYEYGDEEYDRADEILGTIRAKYGDEAAEHAIKAGQSNTFGREGDTHGHGRPDRLAGGLRQGKSQDITKAGKVPKNTQNAMKNTAKNYGRSRINGPQGVLPEGEDVSKDRRYSVSKEFTGHETPRYVVRFQNERIKDFKDAESAKAFAQKCKDEGWHLKEDQLDELSPETLGRYAKKAHGNAMYHDAKAGMSSYSDDERDAAAAKSVSRTRGVRRAIDKLTDKAGQLDELSPDTLKSYIKKASSSSDERSNSNLASRAADKLHTGDQDDVNWDDGSEDDSKSFMRSKGIARAVDKLEELSPDTLKSYVKKASSDRAIRNFDQGFDTGKSFDKREPDHDYDNARRDDSRRKGIRKAVDRLEESGMGEVDLLLQEIARGNVDIYNIYAHPKSNVEKFVSDQIHDKVEQLSSERPDLHQDDDIDRILEIIQMDLEDEYGIDEGAIGRTLGGIAGVALAGGPEDPLSIPAYKVGSELGDKLGDKIGSYFSKNKETDESSDENRLKVSPHDAGSFAAVKGKPYESNPYPKGSQEHLLWSKGHNAMRAHKADMDETVGGGNWLEENGGVVDQMKQVQDEIEKIVRSGGRVGLNDPLSRKLKMLKAKLQSSKVEETDAAGALSNEDMNESTALQGQYGHSGKLQAVQPQDQDMMDRIKFLAGITK